MYQPKPIRRMLLDWLTCEKLVVLKNSIVSLISSTPSCAVHSVPLVTVVSKGTHDENELTVIGSHLRRKAEPRALLKFGYKCLTRVKVGEVWSAAL